MTAERMKQQSSSSLGGIHVIQSKKKSQLHIFAFPHVLWLNDKWQNAAGATRSNSLISKYHTQSLIIA